MVFQVDFCRAAGPFDDQHVVSPIQFAQGPFDGVESLERIAFMIFPG